MTELCKPKRKDPSPFVNRKKKPSPKTAKVSPILGSKGTLRLHSHKERQGEGIQAVCTVKIERKKALAPSTPHTLSE